VIGLLSSSAVLFCGLTCVACVILVVVTAQYKLNICFSGDDKVKALSLKDDNSVEERKRFCT
jgi:hypothetical protein